MSRWMWSGELSNSIPRRHARPPETSAQVLSRKYGMPQAEAEAGQEQMAARCHELGLECDWRSSRFCSTFRAQARRRIAARAGLPGDAVDRILAGDDDAERVRQDVEAARAVGVQRTPF